jgi:PPOX class probable F420-dependent enzyme
VGGPNGLELPRRSLLLQPFRTQAGIIDELTARARVADAMVARLATLNDTGGPDLVPITFAMLEPDVLVTAIDHKPKSTTALRRLANVQRDPRVTVLVDRYDDDWSTLWWVRLRGTALVAHEGAALESAVQALSAKYRQYRDRRPTGPAILVTVQSWRWWAAGSGRG